MKPSRVRRTLCLCSALLLAPLGFASPGDAATEDCPARTREARTLAGRLEAGQAVILRKWSIVGDLELPQTVDAPVVLESSCLSGDLVAAHTSFSRVVDLSNTEVTGRVDFVGAHFEAPVTFGDATLSGKTSFALAVFDEAAHFDPTTFSGPADFSGAEFHDSASFLHASWTQPADFSGTRFERRADFAAAEFRATPDDAPSADFTRAAFDDGATFFLATISGRAEFALASSSGELAFHSVTVNDTDVNQGDYALSFSTARLLGPVSFAGAAIHGPVNFDQAELSELDLAGATLDSTVRLPVGPENSGNLGTLRLDLDDADRLVGPSGGDDHAAQRAGLALAEATARASDNLEAANDARVRRLTIAREDRSELAQSVDLAFNYGLWGYGVRPFHQLIAIVVVLLVGAGARWFTRLRERPSPSVRLGGALHDLGESLQSLLRLRAPEQPWAMVEYLAFKVLVVIFVLNAANVWPVSRDLIQGIF